MLWDKIGKSKVQSWCRQQKPNPELQAWATTEQQQLDVDNHQPWNMYRW